MDSLEQKLMEAKSYRMRLIATDGVFSMDGNIAKLDKITSLAKKYDALLMVDDSHATGFIGETGRGTGEYHQVMDRVDIITSTTLGKALGGASGGFTSGKKEIIEILRQRSRPYLFSNTIPPVIISAALKAFDLLSQDTLSEIVLNQIPLTLGMRYRTLGLKFWEIIIPLSLLCYLMQF